MYIPGQDHKMPSHPGHPTKKFPMAWFKFLVKKVCPPKYEWIDDTYSSFFINIDYAGHPIIQLRSILVTRKLSQISRCRTLCRSILGTSLEPVLPQTWWTWFTVWSTFICVRFLVLDMYIIMYLYVIHSLRTILPAHVGINWCSLQCLLHLVPLYICNQTYIIDNTLRIGFSISFSYASFQWFCCTCIFLVLAMQYCCCSQYSFFKSLKSLLHVFHY